MFMSEHPKMCTLFLHQPSSQCQDCLIGADTRSAFKASFFKACLYQCKIQEMLHPRNWCLCSWKSFVATISVKRQQCSPDHRLRDDILLNTISFLIIFSCSCHPLSLCSSPLLSQNIFLNSLQSSFFPPFSSHMWMCPTLFYLLLQKHAIFTGPSDMLRLVNAWCYKPCCVSRIIFIYNQTE